MEEPRGFRLKVFDPREDFEVVQRRLPHWSQAGVVTFLTWRTWDSIPESVLQPWLLQRRDHTGKASEIDSSNRWNEHLDACYGACVLRRPEMSAIVADSLMHFDGDRYERTDFVVMPNHVHVLVAFPNDDRMLRQCKSWKRFTAKEINRHLVQEGRFWQDDGFDHLVRSAEQFVYLRKYIAENGPRAKLLPHEYRHYSKPM
ncbi:Transposase IS200 like protein [Pirellulimonas nuda]|uniref:Transposase IS200 like protein n=1 Tax=Pirellulimonas nuda TaxID=2528009 RepID=A0A518DHV0_9BACT|nr:transposase [Pirellulimonas nuda]QDU91057.1 Transposase IS200 like protein [Pirellulimonas nuda]